MKKVILILLVILSINSNAIGKNLPLMTSEQIIAKCQPENFNNYTSDKDLSAKVDKENECIEAKLLKLIELNIHNNEYKKQLFKNLEQTKIAVLDFSYIAANYNETCETLNNNYDCGTSAQHLVANNQWQQVLKVYLKLFININEDRQSIYK